MNAFSLLRLFVCLAALVAPATVLAQSPLLSCTGTAVRTYNPGLTLVTRPTDILSVGSIECLPGAPVSSGSYSFFATGLPSSCLLDEPVGTGSLKIDWNTGESSVISFTRILTRTGGQTVLVFVGSIASGPFAGNLATEVVVDPALDVVSCLLGPGITEVRGVTTFAITQF
ncbi:hypothetical protein LXT21_10325 [Myxococcus sp. K38C18041901]|uniref:hypothetical protein n=1 Tax=Myxococcus guangdongensis TaxID=2906760 RepID=UPI0020A78C68|nr:hypothetical protein [Myxococcus guangdongensis]MCP3059167.1 hypothetical protein [Myxococcus guangdongensis]